METTQLAMLGFVACAHTCVLIRLTPLAVKLLATEDLWEEGVSYFFRNAIPEGYHAVVGGPTCKHTH